MKLKTDDGIAEPMPLSDIQRNNRILTALGLILSGFFFYLFWLTYYVIKNNVLNNIVANCV
tara:strand:- start:266 stop:448 length:183 start_codon:yes stop_codon:yes gene_type:complete